MLFEIFEVECFDNKMLNRVLDKLVFLKQEYPDFLLWFRNKVRIGLENGSRKIFVACPSDDLNCIAGVLILKNDGIEKKISTLCVMEDYRAMGLGTEFVKFAMNILETNVPMITVANTHRDEFTPLLDAFGFELYAEYKDYYKAGISEYSYNGFLIADNKNEFYNIAI